jgi:hypothetical protein
MTALMAVALLTVAGALWLLLSPGRRHRRQQQSIRDAQLFAQLRLASLTRQTLADMRAAIRRDSSGSGQP